MGKGKVLLRKTKTLSEQNVRKLAKDVIEKCRTALAAENLIDKNQNVVKTCSPKLSLDEVSEEIKNILSQLNKEPSKDPKTATKPVELKIIQKEFFTVETARKKRTVQQNLKKKPSEQSARTSNMNFFKSSGIKKTDSVNGSACSKSDSLNSIQRSNTLFKKVPVTRSDIQSFKNKIELTALEALKSPELRRLVDKEKVAKNVNNLMKDALTESMTKHEVPNIDVATFISQSMKMSISKDLEDVKKVAEAKPIGITSSTTFKLERSEEMYNEKTRMQEKKINENGQNNRALSPNTNTKDKPIEKQANKKPSPPPAKTDKAKPKPQLQKNSANTNYEVSQKTTSKQSNASQQNAQKFAMKNNKNAASNSLTKGGNQVRTRSNSTLRNSSLSTNKKPSVVSKQSVAQRDSERRLTSSPKRSFSSASTRPVPTSRASPSRVGSSSHSYFPGTSSVVKSNTDPIVQLKEEVNRAIRERKTFTVAGQYPAVRRALVRRGWVERYSFLNRERLQNEMNSLRNRSINQLAGLLQVKDLNEICKKLIRSKMLGSHQVDLYWGHNYDAFKLNSDKVKLTKINKFRRDVFSYTSKQGLSEAARDAHWFNFPGLARINHPRTYVLARNGETKEFVKDFRRTAAMSLLKWIIRSNESKECKIISNSGKIPLETFQFACNECYKMVIEANNQDIDQPLKEASENEWTQFLEYYYKILHIGNHFKASNVETEESIVEKSQYLVNKLAPHYPHSRMDGTMNIWILKPALGSQGKGIHICRTLQYIMNTMKTNSNIRYIAQKYIERPLLIFNTKFDIRQWFLISCAQPLTIWMYRECYLRFSSQTYNLRKLHESVHLTNNSVQKRYQNTSYDITLPNYNMWDSVQFRNYLSNIGYPEIYRQVIYKGMKECIIGAVMVHQDKIDKRRNCFELYGADFMLTEDFQPFLIEINSSPALFASTPVTSRMCPQVLEDTIKVVVDYAANPKAKTGNFELIYRQPRVQCNNSDIENLKVSGRPLTRDYFCLEEDKNAKKISPLSITENLRMEKSLSKTKSEMLTDGVKETLENLLQFIQTEKKRKQQKKLVTEGTDPIHPTQRGIEGKNGSSTSTNQSFASLKSNLNLLAGSSKITFTKEDENMLDQALKMMKSKRDSEVVKYLLEVVERIANRALILDQSH